MSSAGLGRFPVETDNSFNFNSSAGLSVVGYLDSVMELHLIQFGLLPW